MARLSVLSDKKAPTFVGAYRDTSNQCEVLGDMSGFLASDGELAMILHSLVLMPALLSGLYRHPCVERMKPAPGMRPCEAFLTFIIDPDSGSSCSEMVHPS